MKRKSFVRSLVLLIFLLSGAFTAFADVTEEPIYQRDKVGVIVIDVQDYYIPGAKDKDINETIDNIGKVMKIAGDYKLPYYMTFEYATWRPITEHKDHVKIPAQLEAVMPKINSEHYLKTGFDASRQPELIKDLRMAGLKKLVVAGAETDVCVIQTVMGLVRKGFEVYMVSDGVYTSEANERPSFLRMAQSGVKFISTAHFERAIKNNEPITADVDPEIDVMHTNPHAIIDPNQTALLLLDFVQPALDKAVNKSIKPMKDRSIIMFVEADAYKRQVFSVISPEYGNATLPEQFFRPKHYKEYVKKSEAAAESIENFAQMLKERDIYQLMVAGYADSEYLRKTVNHLLTLGIQVYIIQDQIYSPDTHIMSQIESLYHKGAIPMTYKMYSYGMCKGVSPDEAFSWKYSLDLWVDHYSSGKIPWIDMLAPVEP